MSRSTDTVQELYDAFGRGDIPAVLGMMSPRIEWREPVSLPFEDQVGPEAIAQNIFATVPDRFSAFSLDVFELIDAGDAVVVLGAYRGTGSKTGKPLDADFAHVVKLDADGKVAFFRAYTDTHLWREVLGPDAAATVPAQAGAEEPAPTSV